MNSRASDGRTPAWPPSSGTGENWEPRPSNTDTRVLKPARGSQGSVARSRVTLGRVLLVAGELTECEGQLEMALDHGAGVERATTPRAYETLASLAEVRNDVSRRIQCLELALEGYTAGGATIHRRRVERELATASGIRRP